MKLLVDMNLSPRWPRWLADVGIEAVHWSDVGVNDAPDCAIMEYAARNGLTILTRDLDFGAMLAASRRPGPSVVLLRGAKVSPETMGAALVEALRRLHDELETGALLTLDARGARLRVLPLLPPE